MPWQTVAAAAAIPPGDYAQVEVDGVLVAVFNVGGKFYAIDDICTHDGGELASGTVDGGVIECPRHGARFDIKTGDVLSLPAVVPVPTYAVRIEGNEIQVGWA
jgi:3-phenylpropionate/trans-cinnamate dioxygenase ferredoxin subunit